MICIPYLRSQKGFTLLEIMLTTIIFVSLLIPILSLYSSGFVSSLESEITTKVLNLSRARIEELKNLDYFLLEEGRENLSIPPFNFEKVNPNFSDQRFENGIRIITQIFYVDKDNNLSLSDLGLKKIVVSGLVQEKDNKISKRIEIVTLRKK
jgi:prepilin-type N-terminal cleavage/methylation domain-containing protein